MKVNINVPDNLQSVLNKMQLINTVTTGRSGTKLLQKLLGLVPDLQSFHEPEPNYANMLRYIQHHPRLAFQWLLQRKLPKIAQTGTSVYAETSHLFCKGFLKPLVSMGFIPDLIGLQRSNRAVARSLYQLGHIPGNTNIGLMYYLSPEDPETLQLPRWRSLHPYQLCYWYCLEIERRTQEYLRGIRQSGGNTIQITLGELTTREGFEQLLQRLNLKGLNETGWTEFEKLSQKQFNKKEDQKGKRNRPDLPENLEKMETEVSNLVNEPEEKRIQW